MLDIYWIDSIHVANLETADQERPLGVTVYRPQMVREIRGFDWAAAGQEIGRGEKTAGKLIFLCNGGKQLPLGSRV